MPIHPFEPPRGRLERVTIESEAVKGNLLGDPSIREVLVYVPDGYDDGADDYLLFVDLVGYTGSGVAHAGWKPFAESLPQRLDRLVATGKMGPVVLALPDCFTSLGGNQYIDSLAMGDWATFLVTEMLPAIEARFRVRKGREHRAIFGKSSGGYGAIVHGLRYAEYWGAVACHSGDMGFDRLFGGDFPKVLDALARRGGIQGFLDHFAEGNKVSRDDFHVLMILAMGATYDPDPGAPKGIRLPVDARTCVRDPTRWAAWLAHDPVTLIETPAYQENLRRLRGLFIDCGWRDQYAIHYGTRQFVDRLAALGIRHHHEEFDDNHSSIDYRMDASLPFLYRALTAEP